MKTVMSICLLSLVFSHAHAGVLDPDCTAEKAAKSAAAKATVGVGGRCDPKEAAKDTANDALAIDEKKDAVEDSKDALDDAVPGKDHKDDGPLDEPARKAADAVIPR